MAKRGSAVQHPGVLGDLATYARPGACEVCGQPAVAVLQRGAPHPTTSPRHPRCKLHLVGSAEAIEGGQ